MREARARLADPVETLCRKIQYYQSRADELYQEWRRSKADKQVHVVEESGPAGGKATKRKTSRRTETRTPNSTLFTKSMDVQSKADTFKEQPARQPSGEPAGPENAGAATPVSASAAEVENEAQEKIDPPRLTWDQQHAAALRELAERKRKWKRFTDPRYCALR